MKEVQHVNECKPNLAQNEIAVCIDSMKKQASTSFESMPSIYKDCMKPIIDTGLPMVASVPSFNSLKCSLYSARKESQQVKRTIFKDKNDIEVPACFRDMLLAEYRYDGSVILLFCLEEIRQILCEIKECFGDGTFSVAPLPFIQLYVIIGDIDSSSETINTLPIFYALMTDKKESSYLALFHLIKATCPHFKPIKFHADFEIGMSNALKQVFANIEIKKCFYHFCKSLWRKAKEIGLKSKLQRRIVGLCTALSLLPANQIQDGWNYILSACEPSNPKISKFVKYMNVTWLKNFNFINEWCTYQERHRTNNVCENWNSQINKKVHKNYVTIAKLLSALKEDATKLHCCANNRKQTEIDRDNFIRNTQMQLIQETITIGHFLEILR